MIAHAKGDLELASRAYERAIRRNPCDEHALTWLGVIQAQTGNLNLAIANLSKALKANPLNVEALLNLGNALLDNNQPEEAKGAFERYMKLKGPSEPAMVGYCTCLSRLELTSELLAATESGVLRYPNSLDLWVHRASALLDAQNFQGALDLGNDLLKAAPNSKIALLRARALSGLGDDAQAKLSLEKIISNDPNNLDVLIELGNVHQRAADLTSSMNYYQKCLRIDSSCVLAKWNLAHIFLSQKNFREGWIFNKFRWGTKGFKNLQTSFTQAEWDGVTSDKPICLLGEQGIGDQLLYATLALEILPKFSSASMYVNKKIAHLFETSPLKGQIRPIEELDLSNDFYYKYAADLGGFIRDTEDDFPTTNALPPLLTAVDTDIDAFLHSLRYRPTIGLSWHSANPSLGGLKSPAASELSELVKSIDGNFVNIQYGDQQDTVNEIELITGKRIVSVPGLDTYNDLYRLAYLMSKLDLIITISNTTAHLAGFLGLPTILMMPPRGRAKFWYWHTRTGSNRSLWYPSVEVIEHDWVGGWQATIHKALRAALGRLA